VRVISPKYARGMGTWSELAGPFANLSQAEAYVDDPPELLGPVGTVTIDRTPRGYVVLVLEEEAAAA
jgi:hypothetical protein